MGTANSDIGAVMVSRDSISIPTYVLGEDDPNPAFAINGRNIYPYTMLDDLTDRLEERSYRTIVLENEFLRAILLPDMGGRLYSLHDKVHNREVFYRNHVIKYGLVAVRGAWISGGVEFNFPNGHTTVTVSPVASATRVNLDGSASAIIGDVDLVSGMHWQITFILRPNQSRIEQHVKLANSTSIEQPYWFWANAAVPGSEDLHYLLPAREVSPHAEWGQEEFWSYPVWKGVDNSWYKNIRQPTSLFARQSRRNFFAAYYQATDFSVVHVADYHQDPGKKFWTWGVADDGLIWTDLLTDSDGPYNEIQSGRFETQHHKELMPPCAVESWTEYWYPTRGLGGGIVEATPGLALNVVEDEAPDVVRLCFASTVRIEQATIQVKLAERIVTLEPIAFVPSQARSLQISTDDRETAMKSLRILVKGVGDEVLLQWDATGPIDGNPDFVPVTGIQEIQAGPHSLVTAEELFLNGLLKEKQDRYDLAIHDYEDALNHDPDYIPVLLKLGEQAYRAANLRLAESYVARALTRDASSPRIHYTAGLIYRAAGRLRLAQHAFGTAVKHGGEPAPAYLQLGEIAIRQKEFGQAEELFKKALECNPGDPVAETDLAISKRLAGRLVESKTAVEKTLEAWPIFPFARAERWRIGQLQGGPEAEEPSSALQRWDENLTPGPETYLNVAARYRDLDDLASSNAVLEFAQQRLGPEKSSPLISYYLASNAWQEGNARRAEQFAHQAAVGNCDRVFPSRLGDVEVLMEANRKTPDDAQAVYLLGVYFFAHRRYKDAYQLWLQALGLGFKQAVLYRNLGIYSWRIKHDLDSGAGYFNTAIGLEPEQYRFYIALDHIYEERNDEGARDKMFRGAPASVLARDAVQARLCLLRIQQGKSNEALRILESYKFNPWEMGRKMHELFLTANVMEGRKALSSGQPERAEAAFRRALEYPENLGEGEPDIPNDSEALYWLGVALESGGHHEEAQAMWKRTLEEHMTRENSPGGFYASLALASLGRTQESTEILDSLLEQSQQPGASAQILYEAGLAEHFHDQSQAARKCFELALMLDPAFWKARLELRRADH